MNISELILAIGDENVKFQNLDHSAVSIDWTRKSGGKITFGTEEEIGMGGTKRLGLVLWLDRDAVAAAVKAAADK